MHVYNKHIQGVVVIALNVRIYKGGTKLFVLYKK